jgi:competence protein ComEC
MKPARILLLAAGLALAWTASSQADYLEVRRSATLKETPSGSGRVSAHVEAGLNLTLLDDGKETDGYYHITSRDGSSKLWIYHTLVLRHEGDPPGQLAQGSFAPAQMPSGDVMKAHFINLEQGNATLLEFSCGAVLIDAGGESTDTDQVLLAYLNKFFANHASFNKTIETIFITHTHIDHNRALKAVAEAFAVHHYVHNGVLDGSGRINANWMVSNAAAKHVDVEAVSEADVEKASQTRGITSAAISPLHCSGTSPVFHVVAGPYAEDPGWPSGAFDNGNNKSIVIRLDFGSSSFLFPGDMEEDAIGSMVEHYHGTSVLDVDVLQVGHHGSANGTTEDEMAAITPQIAVVSMGDTTEHKPFRAWSYGHPRKDAVDILERWVHDPRAQEKWVSIAIGAKNFVNYDMKHAIYATGWDGNVVITADGNKHYSVATEH